MAAHVFAGSMLSFCAEKISSASTTSSGTIVRQLSSRLASESCSRVISSGVSASCAAPCSMPVICSKLASCPSSVVSASVREALAGCLLCVVNAMLHTGDVGRYPCKTDQGGQEERHQIGHGVDVEVIDQVMHADGEQGRQQPDGQRAVIG